MTSAKSTLKNEHLSTFRLFDGVRLTIPYVRLRKNIDSTLSQMQSCRITTQKQVHMETL